MYSDQAVSERRSARLGLANCIIGKERREAMRVRRAINNRRVRPSSRPSPDLAPTTRLTLINLVSSAALLTNKSFSFNCFKYPKGWEVTAARLKIELFRVSSEFYRSNRLVRFFHIQLTAVYRCHVQSCLFFVHQLLC